MQNVVRRSTTVEKFQNGFDVLKQLKPHFDHNIFYKPLINNIFDRIVKLFDHRSLDYLTFTK